MTEIKTKPQVKEQGYDEVPYSSYPFDYNRPEHLHAVAHLFGVDSPPLENARILEMGSSEGTNLLKFAVDYPKATVLGIDLSSKQVQAGQERIKKMGLKNYELKHMSITDLDESFGKFDYIVCHGVYSWVPDFVQTSILENCNKLLSDKGVAFVSYNTLPGWNMVRTVRELMMYHSRGFDKVEDQIAQARLALDFICDTLKDSDTPYAGFMKHMAEEIKTKEDHYLRHEYLADDNYPCYFHEFLAAANEQNLIYLGDTNYQRMNPDNMPAKTADMLKQIHDMSKIEQYSDFILNSQFRCTLLCKKENTVDRNISFDRLKQFYFSSELQSVKEYTEKDVMSDETMQFNLKTNSNLTVSSNSPALKSVLVTFAEGNTPLTIDEIVDATVAKFKEIKKQDVLEVLNMGLGKLIFSRYVIIHTTKPLYATEISKKPKIHDVDLFRFKNHIPSQVCWMTTPTNRMVSVDAIFANFLEYFDGEHDQEQITEKIYQCIKEGKLTLQKEGKQVTDDATQKASAVDLYKYATELLLKSNLLVA